MVVSPYQARTGAVSGMALLEEYHPIFATAKGDAAGCTSVLVPRSAASPLSRLSGFNAKAAKDAKAAKENYCASRIGRVQRNWPNAPDRFLAIFAILGELCVEFGSRSTHRPRPVGTSPRSAGRTVLTSPSYRRPRTAGCR